MNCLQSLSILDILGNYRKVRLEISSKQSIKML